MKPDNTSPIQIVLAEDNESDRRLFQEAFEELTFNINVHAVSDGVELMSYLAQEDIPLPCLLFLDLNMPRKNGLECLREIRSFERLKEVIITIYSTSSSEKDVNETFLSGANIYVKKPNDFYVLKQVLHKVVGSLDAYRGQPVDATNYLLRI